jgi:hypothetical protein
MGPFIATPVRLDVQSLPRLIRKLEQDELPNTLQIPEQTPWSAEVGYGGGLREPHAEPAIRLNVIVTRSSKPFGRVERIRKIERIEPAVAN